MSDYFQYGETGIAYLKQVDKRLAEMMMLHSMQRPDILGYGDLAIIRGLRMIYSPYFSVASLYIWVVAGGAIENMKDYGTKIKT